MKQTIKQWFRKVLGLRNGTWIYTKRGWVLDGITSHNQEWCNYK